MRAAAAPSGETPFLNLCCDWNYSCMMQAHLDQAFSPTRDAQRPTCPSAPPSSHETPKRPTLDCTPLIQVTWRAKESSNTGDGGSSSSSSQRHFRRTPILSSSQAMRSHLGCGRPSASSINSTSSPSSSSSGSINAMSGGNASSAESSSKLPFLDSPRSSHHHVGLRATTESDLKRSVKVENPSDSSVSMASGENRASTPNRASMSTSRPAFNPFESDLIETMNYSSLSPSVFSTVVTPSKQDLHDFNWGLDHIALLFPTDIEENPNQETPSKPLDPEMEERLQSVINSFFAQKSFAPSPWLDSETKARTTTSDSPPPLPSPPGDSLAISVAPVIPGATCMKRVTAQRFNVDKKDVWCQTICTLPIDFDFERILGQYFTFNCDQECEQQQPAISEDELPSEPSLSDSKDGLSVSSLRRKLFANYEENLSPSLGVGSPLDHADDPVYRLNLSPRTPDRVNTPTTPQFSSSPIVLMGAAVSLRMTMTPPTDKTSPTLSPIKCTYDLAQGSSDVAAVNYDNDVSFMSTERSRSNTPIENRRDVYDRQHRLHLTADNMSILQEQDPNAYASGYLWKGEATRTSYMDVTFDREKRGVDDDESQTISQTTTADLGYQTMVTTNCGLEVTGAVMSDGSSADARAPIVASTPCIVSDNATVS